MPNLDDCEALEPKLVIPGASEPDWGPAGPEAPPVVLPAPTPIPAPAPTVAPPPAPKLTLDGLRVSVSKKRDAVIRFRLNTTGQVTFTFERVLPGTRRGSRCVAPRKTGKRCRRLRPAGTLTHTGTGGENRLTKRLKPGSYRLTASTGARVTFKVR